MEEQEQYPYPGIINWGLPKLLGDLTLTTLTFPLSLCFPSSPKSDHDPDPLPAVPSAVRHLLWRAMHGLLAAVYAGMVLTMLMTVAVIMGILLVNHWVEQPVFVRQELHFDYTDVNPEAVFVFCGGGGGGFPVGHTFDVSVMLLLPESDYNRDIGVFQLMAEIISANRKIIARSSQPTMLQYQSHPIRLIRTFAMGLPLLLGITRETQKITVQILKYKEESLSRTEAIRITLMPRAGTSYLPQLYEAEILVQSRLPRVKQLVHNWRWTLYVWSSLYIYIMLLILVVCFFRTLLIFPVMRAPVVVEGGSVVETREEKPEVRVPEEREFTETLRKWQQYRRKRKAALLSGSTFTENVGGTSASSYTITKDAGPGMEEEVGDSESVCLGG